MRRLNPKSTSFMACRGEAHVERPYKIPYTYGRLSAKRRYIQAIQFVKDHDGCKRSDIIKGIWGFGQSSTNRGYQSLLFANLLYIDYIDYDKNFRYHVTLKGLALLQKAREFDTYK